MRLLAHEGRMTQPRKCPVCEGSGMRYTTPATANQPHAEKCHSCNGRGVVWEPESMPEPPICDFLDVKNPSMNFATTAPLGIKDATLTRE